MRNLMKKNVSKRYCSRLVFGGSLGMLVILALLLVACVAHHHLEAPVSRRMLPRDKWPVHPLKLLARPLGRMENLQHLSSRST
ncbi:MAG TPA: hypothetical protein VEH81_04015 [Ktedonobacteraceae bacterium]|nr:hypothetical protein [Ktedonobacteraceae bacterium]